MFEQIIKKGVRMKRFFRIFLITLLVLICVVTGIYIYQQSDIVDTDSKKTDMEYISSVDLKLLIYGENIKFKDKLEFERITEISEDVYSYDNDYVFLIINDLNGSYGIDKEKMKELIQYAKVNTNFSFFYIGKNSLKIFEECMEDKYFSDDDMFFGYEMWEGARIVSSGIWKDADMQYLEIDEYNLGTSICDELASVIKSNE